MSDSNTLVSNYLFSKNNNSKLSESVINWWNVCLANKRVSLEYTTNEWLTENLELSKQYVYNYYKRSSHTDTLGVLGFWCQFKQLVPVVSETHNSVTISAYDDCVAKNSYYDENEYTSAFTPNTELNQ